MNRRVALGAVTLALGVFLPAGSPLSADEPLARQLDEVMAEWSKRDSPGCAVGLVRDGGLVLAKGYLAKLLGNARVVRYLAQHHQEFLSEFQKIAEMERTAA